MITYNCRLLKIGPYGGFWFLKFTGLSQQAPGVSLLEGLLRLSRVEAPEEILDGALSVF